MKLCKDCKHHTTAGHSDPRVWSCQATLDFCYRARHGWNDIISLKHHQGECGPDAKFFEPLPPKRWWEFWK